MELNFSGIIVGLATFLIIGCFHPIVIRAEYHFGRKCWWVFLVAGLLFTVGSFFIENLVGSTITGVLAFSCFWSILELFEQEKRVEKGWFPANPKKAGATSGVFLRKAEQYRKKGADSHRERIIQVSDDGEGGDPGKS